MVAELTTWFEVMKHGSPHRPEAPTPLGAHDHLAPGLGGPDPSRLGRHRGHTTLREITKEHVLDALPARATHAPPPAKA